MLALTENAAITIRGLINSGDLPEGSGLRIAAPDVNGDGPVYEVGLAPEPEPEDMVLDAAGAQVFLEPSAAERLDDKLLDVRVYTDRVLFTIAVQDD